MVQTRGVFGASGGPESPGPGPPEVCGSIRVSIDLGAGGSEQWVSFSVSKKSGFALPIFYTSNLCYRRTCFSL